jgi:hypothetical protein
MDMIIGLSLVWKKLYTLQGFYLLQLLRSRSLTYSCQGSSRKIELMNYDHFIYAIVLMYGIEIVDAISFPYYDLIKCRYFYVKFKYYNFFLAA